MKTWLLVLPSLLSAPATAIPRFAMRTGYDCSACHVNPSGGGMRTAFARNVFARRFLATFSGGAASDEAFAPELGRHVAIGADLRTGYLWQRPPDADAPQTSAFFTPQADLYLHAQVAPQAALYLDMGSYGGFEAFAIARPLRERPGRDLYFKAGRFVVPFGVRDVNHTIWTREAVGFGPSDRDHGVEVGGRLGRYSGQVALVNGTYGDAFLDAGGSEETRVFDKAVVGRLVLRARSGPLRAWHGASVMYNRNAVQQNPLFVPALFPGPLISEIARGVDEWRAAGSIGLGLGRASWFGEIVAVRDWFIGDLRTLWGYASYQELALRAARGLDVAATYEFADSDVEFARGRVERAGAVIEWFPWPALELRLMGRHAFGSQDFLLGGARDDVELFVHLYF